MRWHDVLANDYRPSDRQGQSKVGCAVSNAPLFELADRTVVGFASLGPTRWRWPLPNGTHTNLAYIPMVGLAKPFHGGTGDGTVPVSRTA